MLLKGYRQTVRQKDRPPDGRTDVQTETETGGVQTDLQTDTLTVVWALSVRTMSFEPGLSRHCLSVPSFLSDRPFKGVIESF